MRPTEPSNIDAAFCSARAAAGLFFARRNAAMRSRASACLIALKDFTFTQQRYHNPISRKARKLRSIVRLHISVCLEHEHRQDSPRRITFRTIESSHELFFTTHRRELSGAVRFDNFIHFRRARHGLAQLARAGSNRHVARNWFARQG